MTLFLSKNYLRLMMVFEVNLMLLNSKEIWMMMKMAPQPLSVGRI